LNTLHRAVIALAFLVPAQVGGAQEVVDIKQFAESFIAAEKAAWERGDFAALEALEHPDVKFQNIDGTSSEGWEAHKAAIVAAKARFNGAPITQEWRYLMGDGNMFSVSYVWTVHFPQRTLQIVGMAVGRLHDGKLIEEWGASRTLPAVANE
jgi:hypothetical protein